MSKKYLERDIERRFVNHVKKLGGVAEKFTSPQKRSVPDRLVTMPDGTIYFVELKATGGKPTAAQGRDHERRRAMGCKVFVISTLERIGNFPNISELENEQ